MRNIYNYGGQFIKSHMEGYEFTAGANRYFANSLARVVRKLRRLHEQGVVKFDEIPPKLVIIEF